MTSASAALSTDEKTSPTFPLTDSHLLKNDDENFLQANLKPSQVANKSSLGLGILGCLPIELRHLTYQEITTTYRKLRFMEDICGLAFIELFNPFESCRLSRNLSKLARARRIVAEQWPRFLRQYAPPNLRVVVIDFAHDHGHDRSRTYLGRLPKICAEISYAAGLSSSKRCDIPRCKHLCGLSAIANVFDKQLHGFVSVVKFLKASLPEARIQMAPTSCLRCPGLCAAILEGIRTDEN
ncbi:MAG: hypothetical protein Q9173_002661 [Seirophora scorigena]